MDYVFRAQDDVRQFLTPGEADRLLRLGVAAAEKSPDWGQGQEFCYEIQEEAYLIDGFERSAFVVRHRGTSYDITFYDGPGSQFIQ